MANEKDVRRIALSLPETDERPSYPGTRAFRVRSKGFAWLRDEGETLVVGVDSLDEKEALLKSEPRKFFTTPHYDGYATILVRYQHVGLKELHEILLDAWMLKAPKRLRAEVQP